MNELIKIKDMTDRYDVTARTLRYYEDMGLLDSTRSDDYAYRLYDEAAVKRLEQILILRKLNVSIKDIQRVFAAPGSEVVLEVLQTKISDIDEEVALLHELKDIIIAFIRQFEQADFSRDSDVKLLYEKAKDIEAQLANVDYSGNPSNVNRLLEVTEKLEKRPDIVRKLPRFYNIFNVSNPMEAYRLYHEAFGVEKVSENYPGGTAHIGIEIGSFFVLLRQEDEPVADKYPGQGCCVSFVTKEELRKAYDLLTQNGKGTIHEDWDWTPLSAFVTDKYSVHWMLCV